MERVAMTDQLDINCLGRKCPRPIIEIAKAARRAHAGAVLRVQADDLAFEADMKAWVENAKATILDLRRDGHKITVSIKLAE